MRKTKDAVRFGALYETRGVVAGRGGALRHHHDHAGRMDHLLLGPEKLRSSLATFPDARSAIRDPGANASRVAGADALPWTPDRLRRPGMWALRFHKSLAPASTLPRNSA